MAPLSEGEFERLPPEAPQRPSATIPPPMPHGPPPARRTTWERHDFERWFKGAAFAVLLLIGAIAALRLYLALEVAITTWLRPQFIPLAQAGFSLVMLLVVVWLIRAWIIGRK